jgi:integrase
MCAFLNSDNMNGTEPSDQLRNAEWSEINLETAEWGIPAEKMKMRQSRIVPLSRQAIQILQELYPLTGPEKYLFPSCRKKSRPISDLEVLWLGFTF